MSKKNILVLAPFPYTKMSANGGALLCRNELAILAKIYNVHVITFRNSKSAETKDFIIDDYNDLGVKVDIVDQSISKIDVMFSKLNSMFFFKPEHASYFISHLFVDSVKKLILNNHIDSVIIQFPVMAQYVKYLDCQKYNIILDVQDAYSVSWFRRFSVKNGFISKVIAFKEWVNWIFYEKKYYPLYNECLVLSEQDKFGLLAYNPSINIKSVALPIVEGTKKLTRDFNRTVGFIGSFSHNPNIEALEAIVDIIAPKILNIDRTIKFVIAGRNPPASLVKRAGENVHFLGFVDSLDSFYQSVSIVIVPLISGGGVKIKTAEALAYGCPIISTSIGIEGIPANSSEDYILCNKISDFHFNIINLLEYPDLMSSLSKNAYHTAHKYCSFISWQNKIESSLNIN